MIHTENDGVADPLVLRASDVSGHPKDWRGEEKTRTINSNNNNNNNKTTTTKEKKNKTSVFLFASFSFVVHLSSCTQRRHMFCPKRSCFIVSLFFVVLVSLDLFYYSNRKQSKQQTNKQSSCNCRTSFRLVPDVGRRWSGVMGSVFYTLRASLSGTFLGRMS